MRKNSYFKSVYKLVCKIEMYISSIGKWVSMIIKVLKYYENIRDKEINFDCYD